MIFRSMLWLLLFFTDLFFSGAQASPKMPNFLLTVAENHAADLIFSLDKFGSSIDPTPSLSHLAQSGYFHKHAYCTNAGKGKTAFSTLTGLSPNTDLKDFDYSQSLARYFKSIGYDTAFFGSWTWADTPSQLGFDHWYILSDPSIFYNPKVKDLQGSEIVEGHATDVVTDHAIRWLKEVHITEKPFFVVVAYQSMSRPWIPPVRMINVYNDEWFEAPDNFFSSFEQRTPANRYQTMNISRDLHTTDDLFFEILSDGNETFNKSSTLAKNMESMNEEQRSAWALSWKPQNEAFARESLDQDSLAIWKFQRFIKNYLRCLLALDENIGRLFNFAQTTKEEFHFIYTAERGTFTGEFGWFGSEWMYEFSAQIPLIFSKYSTNNLPKINPSSIVRDIDLHKFIKNKFSSLSTFQNEPSHFMDEENILYFTHNQYPGESHVPPHHGLRTGMYKIIHYYPFDEWEFYDLLNDPKEEKNIFHESSYFDLINHYQELLTKSGQMYQTSTQFKQFSEPWKRKQRSPDKKTR